MSSDDLRKLLYFWQLFSISLCSGNFVHINTQDLVLSY